MQSLHHCRTEQSFHTPDHARSPLYTLQGTSAIRRVQPAGWSRLERPFAPLSFFYPSAPEKPDMRSSSWSVTQAPPVVSCAQTPIFDDCLQPPDPTRAQVRREVGVAHVQRKNKRVARQLGH